MNGWTELWRFSKRVTTIKRICPTPAAIETVADSKTYSSCTKTSGGESLFMLGSSGHKGCLGSICDNLRKNVNDSFFLMMNAEFFILKKYWRGELVAS